MNRHAEKISSIIEEEIKRTEKELSEVKDSVERDIELLLSEHADDLNEETRNAFKRRHFDKLKELKERSLKDALSKLIHLKNSFTDECRECENKHHS